MTKEARKEVRIMGTVASEYGLVRVGDVLQVPGPYGAGTHTVTVEKITEGKILYLDRATGECEPKLVRYITGTARDGGWTTPQRWTAVPSQRVTKVR